MLKGNIKVSINHIAALTIATLLYLLATTATDADLEVRAYGYHFPCLT